MKTIKCFSGLVPSVIAERINKYIVENKASPISMGNIILVPRTGTYSMFVMFDVKDGFDKMDANTDSENETQFLKDYICEEASVSEKEDFLGYPINANVLENLEGAVDEVLMQMPPEEVKAFVVKFGLSKKGFYGN